MPRRGNPGATTSRKQQHVDVVLRRDVGFKAKSTGLASWEFTHNALPELDFQEVDSTCTFLGRPLAMPFMVSSMTGGYRAALRINRQLAAACEAVGVAMGVGSQRQALEDSTYHRTFSIVREVAPSIPVVANLGAAEVAQMRTPDASRRLVDLIRADALAVHLNPLQELLQPEGNPRFRGVLAGIAMLVRSLPVPIIIKEVGAGISADVARRLLDQGVRHIDIAGAGGTSWAGVEILRRRRGEPPPPFWDWGIPTADAIHAAAKLRSDYPPFTLIASGGISGGLDAAKCFALGADMVAAARPILHALAEGGTAAVIRLIRRWERELKGAMFLTGSATIHDLQHAQIDHTTTA